MEQYDEYNENIKDIICKNIKKYRNIKGMSIMELAETIDVSVDHLKKN